MLSILLSDFNITALITYLLSAVFVVFFTMPIHEFAHALTAHLLGDNTAKYQGRLTLNPLAHIDPLGAVMIALVGFGWAKPVQVNLNNFKKPKLGIAITAAAGPITNLICAFLLIVILKVILMFTDLNIIIVEFIMIAAYINVSLAVFNLMPVPPLDGSKILNACLPFRWYYKILQYEGYVRIALLILLATNILSRPLSWLSTTVFNGLCSLVNLPYHFI